MSRVEEIKAAIDKLSFRERCELNALMQNWPDDEWDRQLQADAGSGKLDWMFKDVERAEKEESSREFPTPSE